MEVSIDQYYSIKENVYKDLCEVRKLFSTNTTEPQAKAGYKALLMMRLYCPDNCMIPVDATIDEFEYRMKYAGINYLWEQIEGVDDGN